MTAERFPAVDAFLLGSCVLWASCSSSPDDASETEDGGGPTQNPDGQVDALSTPSPPDAQADAPPTQSPDAQADAPPTQSPDAQADASRTEPPDAETDAGPTDTPVSAYLVAAGIGVSDLERSVDFYTRVVGMTVILESELEDREEVTLEFEDSRGSAVILVHYTDSSERNYTDNPVKLVFYVPDPVSFAQAIEDEGLPIPLQPAPLEDFGGAVVGFGKDPDGYLIEIVEDTSVTVPYLAAAGIGVEDLETSKEFYTNAFGMNVLYEIPIEGFMNEVILRSGLGKGSAVVLMHFTDGSERNYKDNPVKLVHHVLDASELVDAIRDAGGSVVAEAEALASRDNSVVGFAKDLDGYLLEMVEAPEDFE